MTPQALTQPTFMAASAMSLGTTQQAHVSSDMAYGTVSARPSLSPSLSPSIRAYATSNPIALTESTSGIEVERRGAERVAQVLSVTSTTTDRTQARTPRTARPAFTQSAIRPSTMTHTTNHIRRASGNSRSLP